MLKFDEPFRYQEKLIFNSLDLGVEIEKVLFCNFWLIFCPLDPADPRIHIFLRILIQEGKIRILSSV